MRSTGCLFILLPHVICEVAPCQVGEEGAEQTGDWEGKARSEETGEEFQDTIGQPEERQGGNSSFKYFSHTEAEAFDQIR